MPSTEQFTQVLRDWAEVFMRRSMSDFKRFIDDSGLSPSQISALMRLYYGGKCGVSDIGNHLGVTNAAASQMVDRMVQLGLFTRNEDTGDRRVKQIALTSQGRELVEKGVESRRRWMEKLTTTLSPEEQDAIIGALMVLTGAARHLESEDIT